VTINIANSAAVAIFKANLFAESVGAVVFFLSFSSHLSVFFDVLSKIHSIFTTLNYLPWCFGSRDRYKGAITVSRSKKDRRSASDTKIETILQPDISSFSYKPTQTCHKATLKLP
jgi:hypothetical protein